MVLEHKEWGNDETHVPPYFITNTSHNFAFERINHPSYETEIYQGGENTMITLGPNILAINRDTFSPIFKETTRDDITTLVYIAKLSVNLLEKLKDPKTILVVLREKDSKKMVGFTYGYPLSSSSLSEMDKEEIKNVSYTEKQFQDIQAKTLEIGETCILPEHRSKGSQEFTSGWSMMMNAMENKLQATPSFKYMLRTVRTGDNYADKVKSRYGKSIMYEGSRESPFGHQMHYRILLHK